MTRCFYLARAPRWSPGRAKDRRSRPEHDRSPRDRGRVAPPRGSRRRAGAFGPPNPRWAGRAHASRRSASLSHRLRQASVASPRSRRCPAATVARGPHLELAAAQQRVHTFDTEGIADREHAAASLERAQRRVSHLQELMSREGWNLTARRYGQLDQWLEKSGLGWPSKMYRGFSDVAHQRLPEWAGGPGNEPTWQLRAVRYEQCLVIHGNIRMLGLYVAQPQCTGAFVAAVDELRHDPILASAFRGELD